jgi:lipoyl(octanoyl) transferase
MRDACYVYRLGRQPYETAWRLQNRLAEAIAGGQQPPTLLLLEHPHTFTFGRRGQARHLLWGEAELARRGVSVHWVDRGGDVTYHGPGQLVGYPLLPLATPPQADYLGYLRRLEAVLIAALARLDVPAIRLENLTGVWLERPAGPPAKVAAIGVKVDARGVTRHGFALNVDPQMEYWSGIVGCGLTGHAPTSLAEYRAPAPPLDQVCEALVTAFGAAFNFSMVEMSGEPAR